MPVPLGPAQAETRYGMTLQQIANATAAPNHALGLAPIANRQAGVHCASGKVDFPVADFAAFD
jgi:hypothetical protein